MSGFRKSDAAVMVVHGVQDPTVPITIGYDTFYKKYGDDPRFSFVRVVNRGHDVMKEYGQLDEVLLAEVLAFLDAAV
jgi:hypothetical protein